MKGSHPSESESDVLVSRLCEGVHLLNQLRELNTGGSIELDWNKIRSLNRNLDQICRTLSEGHEEIRHVDCKRLDNYIEARQKFTESLKKWMAEARAIVELQIDTRSDATVQTIAFRVFDLERRLGRKGIDIRSVAQARFLSNSFAEKIAESRAVVEAKKGDEKEILRDLEEKYREAFRQMDNYEKCRVEDTLKAEKVKSKSTDLTQKIKHKIRVVQKDDSHINSVSFSREILSFLISDKVADLVEDEVKDTVNMLDAFAKFQIDNLTENMLEDLWNQFRPTLAIVDALEPRRR